MPRKRLLIVRILLIVSGVYLVCLVFLSLTQRRMMYFPCTTSHPELEKGAGGGFRIWRNERGDAIGWRRASKQGSARRSVLVLHGNAGCAGDRFHYADAFQAIEPMDFYILEYPGYGGRAGAPTQSTILRAAEEALESIPVESSVFLIAESLGTGAASFLAGAHPERVRGVLLIAPYNSMTAVAQRHMPLFPVRAILRDKYPSGMWLSKYRGPVAVLLAGRDAIIPTELGRNLYDRRADASKK